MTDTQPYTAEELQGAIQRMADYGPGWLTEKDLETLARDHQRLLAEVAALRVAVEMGERELQAVFLALNPECPAHPGQPNTCDNGVCDCFGDVNMGQQVAVLRADKERMDWMESAIPDGRFKRLSESLRGEWHGNFRQWVDAARSGGEGEG